MSYQRALFYFAQLSTMIFSLHLASTRGSTSEILRHGRDLTCLIHRVCCRGAESFHRWVPHTFALFANVWVRAES